MLYGYYMDGSVLLTTDMANGLPIVETDMPSSVPAAYHAEMRFVESDKDIRQVWDIVPDAGTPQDAAVILAQLQAATLSDEDALKVPALYPLWDEHSVAYKTGDRVLYNSVLYKVLQDHTSQGTWTPDAAPSLYAKVLADSSTGEVPEWEQPGSTNGYAKGDKVTHNSKTYESLVDNNVWEPGASGTESLWREV